MGGVLVALLAAPILLHHWAAISNYYLRLHATGPQRYIRAVMFKNTNWRAAIAYYPRSLALHHAGLIFVGLSLVLLAIGRVATKGINRSNVKNRRPLLAFALVCLLVPLVALTLDVDKNAAVGDVLVGPLLWVVLLLSNLSDDETSLSARPPRAIMATALLSIIAGIGVQIYSYTRPSEFTSRRAEVQTVLGLYDHIWAVSRQNAWQQPAIANDSFADFLFPSAVNVAAYERHGDLLKAHEILATDYTGPSKEQILQALEQCQFAVLSHRVPERIGSSPFDQSIHAAHDAMGEYCRQHLTPIQHVQVMDHDVTLLARPQKSRTADAGGR